MEIKILIRLSLLFYLFGIINTVNAQSKRERLSLDNGWRFHLGELPFPEINGHSMSYNNAKAGKSWGAAAPEYDDTKWRLLNLPHDWAVEQPFDSTTNLSQGYRKRGIGWYRRNFKLATSDRGKHLELQFDGVATHCTVWVNGIIVHRNWSGYTSFYIDITPFVKYGGENNNIAIKVDANSQEGWWYEGAGLYRHTWLVKRSPVHIITDGVYAQPIKLAKGSWAIPVEVTIENSGMSLTNYDLEVVLFDKNHNEVTKSITSSKVLALRKDVAVLRLAVISPELWSIESPTLYTVKTIIKSNNIILDSLITTCGFRTIRFDAKTGFYLNDKPVKIKGVCNHQDHAGVGVAVPNSLWDFRLRKLKEMGVNGYRCAHNPPAAEFLDATDRLGILVMDENRSFNTSPEYIRQLEWLIRRDRNHPSVILWSVFNEEPMQGTESGYEMVRRMTDVVKQLDTVRPVTAAANGGLSSQLNVSHAVDVVGMNYQHMTYDIFHQLHPDMKVTSSEDASAVMTRGEYVNNPKKRLIESYDTQWQPWGLSHRDAWKAVNERPYVAGCFVWTGFDYRGEPQPNEWPSVSSSFGILDLCGFPKTAFYIHQAQWLENKNILHLIPHWNWPKDSIGKDIRVMALSNAEQVKLYLNGKIIQNSLVDKYDMNTWKVPYQPGKLEAIAYKGGKEVSRFVVETTGNPVRLDLIPDRMIIDGEGWDAVPVTVRVLDSKGRPIETSNVPVKFELTGPGNIIGLGNGNPNSHEPEKGNIHTLYNGLAQVILQSKSNSSGNLSLKAISPGLKDAVVNITVKASHQIPVVPTPSSALVVDKWLVSKVTLERPDPHQTIASFDMNSWAPTSTGELHALNKGRFLIYRSSFTPYSDQQALGSVLIIKQVVGKAEVYVNKKLMLTKDYFETNNISIILPPGEGEHIISVLLEGEPNQNVGLGGIVIQ